MRHAPSAALLAVAFICFLGGNGNAQSTASLSARLPRNVLHLNGKNNGQHVSVRAGQLIEITLGTIGPGQYGSAQISSSAVRLQSVVYPHFQIPAGPTQVYRFRAGSKGEALIKIPHIYPTDIRDPNPAFAVTISVHSNKTVNPTHAQEWREQDSPTTIAVAGPERSGFGRGVPVLA